MEYAYLPTVIVSQAARLSELAIRGVSTTGCTPLDREIDQAVPERKGPWPASLSGPIAPSAWLPEAAKLTALAPHPVPMLFSFIAHTSKAASETFYCVGACLPAETPGMCAVVNSACFSLAGRPRTAGICQRCR